MSANVKLYQFWYVQLALQLLLGSGQRAITRFSAYTGGAELCTGGGPWRPGSVRHTVGIGWPIPYSVATFCYGRARHRDKWNKPNSILYDIIRSLSKYDRLAKPWLNLTPVNYNVFDPSRILFDFTDTDVVIYVRCVALKAHRHYWITSGLDRLHHRTDYIF